MESDLWFLSVRSSNTLTFGILGFFSLLVILATPVPTIAQSDASGNWGGQTEVQRVDRKDASTGARSDHDVPAASPNSSSIGNVKVSVDASKVRTMVGYRAFGVNTSVSDNNLVSPQLVELLNSAAINTLRYPGGNHADSYHWSTYKATRRKGESYYATNNNFGYFAMLLGYVQNGTAIITVNYGSNLVGSGGGEPAEAAAWVAYCNGDPSDQKAIGTDSTGFDWKTVGFWASVRASQPIAEDDGFNLLRIGHVKPLNIKYWEIGNEVYANGYYEDDLNGGREQDMHAGYGSDAKDSDKIRHKNPALSPAAYGKTVAVFARAMKAVDPNIKVGAVLVPPLGDKKAIDWNPAVMAECGSSIDFASLRWYTGGMLPPDWKDLDEASLLRAPQQELPRIASGLLELFQKYSAANASKMQFVISEIGSQPFAKVTAPVTQGLFAADAYATLMEMGTANVSWSELHANHFLDDKNIQGPAYYGVQMVHLLANINDQLLDTKGSNGLIAVHAAKRVDGSIAVMLINKSPKEKSTVKVQIVGAQLGTQAARFDWGKQSPTDKYPVTREVMTGVGSSFSVAVPPYTVTTIVISAKTEAPGH